MSSFDRDSPVITMAIVVIVGILLLILFRRDTMSWGPEFELIQRIRTSDLSQDERTRLISKLDAMPIEIYQYHDRWMLINDVSPFEAWTFDGYDSTRSDVPRDVQLLWAVNYGTSDINNGGFHQFFGNGTGVLAPEMVEWFERSNLHRTAAVMRKAIAVFGDEYPRSQPVRREFLSQFPGSSREEWDPFYDMDDEFYASLPNETFSEAADRWLREICRVTSLHDRLESNKEKQE